MIKYEQLNKQEQSLIQKEALVFFNTHKSKIYKQITPLTEKIAPSGSDLYHPELWKTTHWKWFLDNNFLL